MDGGTVHPSLDTLYCSSGMMDVMQCSDDSLTFNILPLNFMSVLGKSDL